MLTAKPTRTLMLLVLPLLTAVSLAVAAHPANTSDAVTAVAAANSGPWEATNSGPWE